MTPDSIPPAVAERLREEGRKQERGRIAAGLSVLEVTWSGRANVGTIARRSAYLRAAQELAAVRRAIEEGEG